MPAAAPATSYRRPFSRSRNALSAFAMLACAGIALVSVSDPYAGATAAPFYQKPEQAPVDKVQRFAIQGGYVLVDVKRDKFQAVKPVVVVHQTALAATGGSADVALASAATAPAYTTPTGTAQAYAAGLVAARGWGAGEFSCLVNLWNRESGWNTHAYNPSGAYGIPQSLPGSKMAAFGADWQNDYKVQIQWGLSYISGSYGSPCGAWNSEISRGWY
ncbi:lytic transglycosylase domain-containing protein [Amnibacterium sp. CER49]|uniref:aggregation-promoting factor C-terminal-like domain-containing protein n=1 Tax=Amnibacterium sp. CER49 TaxID=3039161 RepID=UPI002446942B|nr:lytic transglycosylase domain-containing protein [Amnibacterium sp. CER49]MDH2442719.1 lytic transglycosylase domain-containing protein [Amnibacterium sp. CER49]